MQLLTRFKTLVLIALAGVAIANAQTTTISATVVDQASTVWANGTWKIDFVPNPNYNANNIVCGGVSFPSSQWTTTGTVDGAGFFSQSGVKSNNFCTPSGSTYTLTVCPNATSPCSVILRVTISGSSQDLSSIITANSPAPSVLPAPIPRAYTDNEIKLTPSQVGYFYQNVTTNQPRYWGQDQIWHNFVVGVAGFTAGNLNPLFTTSTGADPSNPNLTFAAEAAAASSVYANCTGTSANPTFCLLTANMIPALPYLPSSTSFFYQTVDANAIAQPQRAATNYSTNFTVTDSSSPSRTNVDLAPAGTANTYTCPTSLTTDAKGRVTSVTTGTCLVATNYQTASAVGCSTPTGTGQNCTQVMTWSNGGFADTNYIAVCNGRGPFTSGSSSEPNAIDMTGISNYTTTSVSATTTSKGSSGPASFTTIDCIAIHNH